MKKIPTLFKRDSEWMATPEVTPGFEWVLRGEGVATVKYDGSCTMIKDGKFYKRYDAKKGKKPPEDVRPVVHGEWEERRKHKWKRYSDGTIDYFAGVDCGYHNGPLCLKCGFSFCEHCYPEGYDSECPVPDYICTVCGSEASERGKYCPNCGARMGRK